MSDVSSGGPGINPTNTGVVWTQVRDAALRAVRRGWPIVPGVCRRDALGFPELVPFPDTDELVPLTDPAQVQEIWARWRPPGVLLVCGKGIDAIEAPPWLALRLPALADNGLRVHRSPPPCLPTTTPSW